MIYLIRHGQTDWNLERRIQGHLDIPLNECGKKEALICAKKVQSLNIENIISSDLCRAKETAEIINEFLRVPISFDARLRELNYGQFQGQIGRDIGIEKWEHFNKNPSLFNAETLDDICNRVKSFFKQIDNKKNTLIVTHGGVIRVAMYLKKIPDVIDLNEFKKGFQHLKIKNTQIVKFDFSDDFSIL